MSFFDRFRRRSQNQPRNEASSQTHAELEAFITSRSGVEAYIEPPTAVYAMTLCLVAADGEYLRRPVKHAKQAHQLCNGHGVPIYDARIVGYPRRMRDYERGLRSNGISIDDLPPLQTTDETERDD